MHLFFINVYLCFYFVNWKYIRINLNNSLNFKTTRTNNSFVLYNLQKLCKTLDSNQALEEAAEREEDMSVNDQEMAERCVTVHVGFFFWTNQ